MKPINPVPFWTILITLVACALIVYFVLPDKSKMLERLIHDRKFERAYQVWKTLPAEERRRDPAQYDLIGLRLKRELLDRHQAGALTRETLLNDAVAAYQRYGYRHDFAEELHRVIPRVREPEKALAVLEPVLKDCPVADKEPLMRALVKAALEEGEPGVAAQAYEICWTDIPATEENAAEFVRIWRFAQQPLKALAVLEDFENRSGAALFQTSPSLGDLRIDLLREVERNREAFDLLYSRVEASGKTPDKETLERLSATAANDAQQVKLIGQYQKYLMEHGDDEPMVRQLAELAVSTGELEVAEKSYSQLIGTHPDDASLLKKLAQIEEWRDKPEEAFKLYLRLAEQKDFFSLDRMIMLNPGLYRDNDILRVFQHWKEAAEEPKYSAYLARLLTKHGEYEAAERYFRKHLTMRPEDQSVLEDLGEMLRRQFQYEKARPVFKELAALRPEELRFQERLAELDYLLGDFEASFESYQRLAHQSNDPGVLQNYATLAESLGHFKSFADALARQIKVAHDVTAYDYLKLAYAYNLSGLQAERRKSLEEGLARYPKSEPLRLQLAVVLTEQKDPQAALSVLEDYPALNENLTALSLYLNLLVDQKEYVRAVRFLKDARAQEKTSQTPGLALLAAVAYQGVKDHAAVERIYRRLYEEHPEMQSVAFDFARALVQVGKFPEARQVLKQSLRNPGADVLKEAAQIYGDMGDYTEAERLQKQYLAVAKVAAYQDWTYLGDIYSSVGKQAHARQAYERALSIFQQTRGLQPR